MIEVDNLSKTFKSGDTQVKAVEKVSLKLKNGQFASILGTSGSGKSTLLGLLGGLDRATSGQIIIDNKDITKFNESELIKYRCNKIGFIFQSYNLISNLSALENVMLPMEFKGTSKILRQERAKELLKEVGLNEDQIHRKPPKLSGGQQQRVAIARALANHPAVILADEPTGNLDSKTARNIIDLLYDLSRTQKTTIILVTHDTTISKRSDVVFRINDGKFKNNIKEKKWKN